MSDPIITGEKLSEKPILTDSKGAELYGIKGGQDYRVIVGSAGGVAEHDRLVTVELAQTAGAIGYETKALMDADLAHADGTLALVTNDDIDPVANNGVWRKSGASGSGSWAKSADRVTGLEADVADLSGKWSNVAGKINGWIDPFFRTLGLGDEIGGRARWRDAGGLASSALVENGVFFGRSLRRTGTAIYGPVVYLDELGAAPGDTVTIRAVVTAGALGGKVTMYARPYNVSGAPAAAQITGSNVIAGSTPQVISATFAVPAGTHFIWVYPTCAVAGADADIAALWAVKGDADSTPDWPTLDDPMLPIRVAENEADIATVSAVAAAANAASGYAVDSQTAVSGSVVVAQDVSAIGANARDLVYCGWGETCTPASLTFNAVRVRSIARTAGASARWRNLKVVVRTGATPAAAGSTVVAVGSSLVLESSDTLSDVTILLRDPTTSAVKTLDDSSFSGGQYFIGVYATTSSDAPAACGEPRATMANTVGQSYYHMSTAYDPLGGAWAATTSGSNKRLGVQHLLITSPAESVEYLPSQQLVTDLGGMQPLPAPEIVVPPYVYATQGRECNVYLDNLHLADASEYLHKFSASPSVGKQLNERWTWTPSAAQAAGTITFSAHDKRTGAQLVSRIAQLRAAAATAGTGATKKVLVIGDSLINNGTITQTMLDIVTGGDPMGLTLLGTRGTGSNKHEGRGGWTVTAYTTNYSDGTYGSNPFWKSGAVNFGQYLTDNSIATPDWVFIHLGINDVFSQTDDAACSVFCDSTFTSLDTLIASIKAADANIKVGLLIPSPPSADQDSFGLSEALGSTRWRFKRNILIWARQLIAKYAGQEASRIYVVPSNTALDTVNNMSRAAAAPVNSRSSVTNERQNNGVHPATSGYQQICDALWAFLKFYS